MTTIEAPTGTNTGTSPGAVTAVPAADPATAAAHFSARLAVETDSWDVAADLREGRGGFLLVDSRPREAYTAGHLPGAVSLPHALITEETVAGLPRDTVLVAYCWGPRCNAAHKAGAKLALLGFRVKEMLGGWEDWQKQGHPAEQGPPADR